MQNNNKNNFVGQALKPADQQSIQQEVTHGANGTQANQGQDRLMGAPQPRQRANSSLTDLAVHDSQKMRQATIVPVGLSTIRPTSNFSGLVRGLIDDKYNREYKLDRRTRAKAIETLNDYYKKNQDEANGEDDLLLHTTVRAAILIASKCQINKTEDGQQIRGCGYSTSMFLRGRPQIQIEVFQQKLQELRLEANLEQGVIQECVKVQNKIGLNLNFYDKFSKLWDSLDIRDKSLTVSAAQQMKKLTWLMFIIGKNKILPGVEDIAEMAFLLFACLYWAVMLSPVDIQSNLINSFKDGMGEQKTMDGRLSVLDTRVKEFLSKTLKAQQSSNETDYMIGCLEDMLLKMKAKSRLQGFSNVEDEIDAENNIEVAKHLPMTYEGICDTEITNANNDAQGDNYCLVRPIKCLHGIYDQGNLIKNVRMLDQYYAQQMNCEIDFDERFFINHNGLQHTPIKLVSPLGITNITPVNLQQNSSTGGHKSPIGKSVFSGMAAQNHQAFKRPRGGDQIPLKFVTPGDIQQQINSSNTPNANNTDGSAEQQLFGGKDSAQPMQRRLEFTQSLNEMSLREQLNMQSFPQTSVPNQSPMLFNQQYHSNTVTASPNMNLQTPIGQMMALKHWVDNLQNEITLDPTTGFLSSLPNYVQVPNSYNNQEKQEYLRNQGIEIRQFIEGMLSNLLQNLHHKRVMERPQDQIFHNEIMQRNREPIYKLCCCLMEKSLQKELRRYQINKKQLPDIVKIDIFQKSFLIYACVIHLYSKNINDLSVQEMLEEIKLPAFELWVTFNTFINLDPSLPRQLREHFLDIERQLTLHLIWQKDTTIVQNLQKIIAQNKIEESYEAAQRQSGGHPNILEDEEGKVINKNNETMQQMHQRINNEEKAVAHLQKFYKRVKQIAANTIHEMCDNLKISEECREFIWNILLVTLGLKSSLLFGRHLDQLIMCAIYGVCKIHAGNKTIQVHRSDASGSSIKFQDIIDSYKEIHKHRLQKSGRWQVNISQSNSVSWVYIEVPLDPEAKNPKKLDIIKFYNEVYLERMKSHILKTKSLTLDQGSKTPVLNQSNFDALLTPGGRSFKPVINHFTKMTPLIDSLNKNKRFSTLAYVNQPGGNHLVNNAGALATPAMGSTSQRGLPFMTPRTNALYAANERHYDSQDVPISNPGEMAKNYANVPVHKLATQISYGNNQAGANKMLQKVQKIGSFVSLVTGPSDPSNSNNRPAQPTLTMGKNLGQMKAPTIIAERPAIEESDMDKFIEKQQQLAPPSSISEIMNRDRDMKSKPQQPQFKLDRNMSFMNSNHSPNSIVGNFYQNSGSNNKPIDAEQQESAAAAATSSIQANGANPEHHTTEAER